MVIPFIDWHSDTIILCDDYWAQKAGKTAANLRQNNLQIDLLRLQRAGCLAQFFAIFVNMGKLDQQLDRAKLEFTRLQNVWQQQINSNNDLIAQALSVEDIYNNQRDGKISAFMALEEGGVISSLDELQLAYESGVRYITLTWNYPNNIGFPAYKNAQYDDIGLSDFGKQLVETMNDLNMLIDISHVSPRTANDVLNISKQPVIASHANSYAVCDLYERNIDDNIIKRVAENGGVIGITFVPAFLDGSDEGYVDMAAIVRHLRHIENCGGLDCLAIGSDFDGMSLAKDSAIGGTQDMPRLAEYLASQGYSVNKIEKIFYRNSLRLMTDIWG